MLLGKTISLDRYRGPKENLFPLADQCSFLRSGGRFSTPMLMS
jgi:hypothetical protein